MQKTRKLKIEKQFKKLIDIIESFFQAFLYFGFGMFIYYAIFIELINFNKDTFGLTNYGFAIMLGLSSICFSWARNLVKDKEGKAKRLMDTAIEALYGAIVFLMGSGFKYVALAKDNTYLSSLYVNYPYIVYIPKALAFLCFLVASIRFFNVTIEILKIIALTNSENWEKEIINKEK